MLVPLTRKKIEELFPIVATSDQYRYCWGKLPDFLRRLLISIGCVLLIFVLRLFLPRGLDILEFSLGIIAGLYWLWGPVFWASQRNLAIRKFEFGGFWRGQVLDVFITEETVGKEETVNKQGDLVVIENRERRLNLEVGDKYGFEAKLKVPLKRSHQSIRRGDIAEMIVLSNRPDLSRILKISDIYMSEYNVWVSDYPYTRRDTFRDVSRELGANNSRRFRS